MGNELAVVKEQRPVQILEFSSAQTKLLADTIAKGCDENELRLFLEIAKLKRLDPFSGQIRPVKRWDSEAQANKMVIQTGIDGYRSTASRTGELAGIEDAEFDSEDGDNPKWAKVVVYRWSHGEKIPYRATARWGEYVQKKRDGNPNSMWLRMPYLMLAKCAEALALRKAFPDELAGVYTDEEMGQADNIIEGQTEPTQQQLKAPVPMPQALQSPQQPDNKPVTQIIGGVIGNRREGKEGELWLTLGDNLVAVPSEFVSLHPFGVGHKMSVTVLKKKGKEREFWILQKVEGYEVVEVPPGEVQKAEKKPDAIDEAVAKGQVAFEDVDKEPIGSLEETRTGVIGRKREIRLQTLMGKNKDKNHGLTWEGMHKILDGMEPPVAHVRDLPAQEWYSTFEKLVTGEEDWRELV